MNFTVNKPLKGHDEDAPAYADDKFLIVCDGLGGGGQNSYLIDGEKRTSAYLGSRKISLSCQEYLNAHSDEFFENMKTPEHLIAGLKTHISESLTQYVLDNDLKNIVKGKSMQMLPSTLATIVYKQYKDHTDALVISAGDSRAFVLTPDNGLQQISRDDVFDNVDAFDKSATMTNNIRQDGDFHINYGYYSLPSECILLVCTDGCFDYISTPMELEFRLEYAISKCGDLFEPNKDNLGEYFGNVLVSSGLKDDCTMAGAIIGYNDSEETKKLFLKRALHVQEKYRNPYAIYDKESLKRKNEVGNQSTDIENQIKDQKKKIDSTIKAGIQEAFLYDMRGGDPYTHDSVKEIAQILKNFPLYQSFVDELKSEEENVKKRYDEKNKDYMVQREQLKAAFKQVRFEEFVNNLTVFNPMSFFSTDRTRYANEYKRMKQMVQIAEKKYKESLDQFSVVFDDFKKPDSQLSKALDGFSVLKVKFQDLQFVYNEYISAKHEMARCEESLKRFYMENDMEIEQEFASAWKKKFSAYFGKAQYKGITEMFEKCMMLQKEIESCKSLTLEEKNQKFKEYLEANLLEFTKRIQSDAYISRLLCGNSLLELSNLESKLVELQKFSNEFDEKKYGLWMEYKPLYELYNHWLGGRV